MAARGRGDSLSTQNAMQRQGAAISVLLHGLPGMGKTATVEAMAQRVGKPFFAIAARDLGLDAREQGRNLHEIFRLGELWDCILLFEDIESILAPGAIGGSTLQQQQVASSKYLSSATFKRCFPQRLSADTSLGFLQEMERYNGVVFLTSNRPGRLGEVLVSHLLLQFHYGHLTARQYRDIWETNLDRLKTIEEQRCGRMGGQPLQIWKDEIMEFVTEHYRTHPAG